jgi:peptidoglycan/xylan/chitin deacetylase (PgdA/CDA1 family)
VRWLLTIVTVPVAAWLLTQTAEPVLRLALVTLVLELVVAAVALRSPDRQRSASVVAVLTVAAVTLTGSWIGANSAEVTWFGSQVGHVGRDRREVALTFDDGPNVSATLAIARILEAHHTKGTFFSVGKAVNRRPDITRALAADGHLIGNHSYHHDSTHWLDPRYLELGKAQRAIGDRVGVCPAFFRAPHGQHTPFMAAVVRHHHMVMVGWDVSSSDWSSHDAAALARRILARSRGGSIIDLHDGLDGKLTVDRTVLLRALPLILDGLEARGLRPVRLDVLLRRPGYVPGCTARRRVQTRAAANGMAPRSMAASMRLVRDR